MQTTPTGRAVRDHGDAQPGSVRPAICGGRSASMRRQEAATDAARRDPHLRRDHRRPGCDGAPALAPLRPGTDHLRRAVRDVVEPDPAHGRPDRRRRRTGHQHHSRARRSWSTRAPSTCSRYAATRPVARRCCRRRSRPSMLLPRAQDEPGSRGSPTGVFGTKAFVFTDDLDVTNRLYLLPPGRRGSALLQPAAPTRSSRRSPRCVHWPGGDLDRAASGGPGLGPAEAHRAQVRPERRGLKVSRTTSQDAGVDADCPTDRRYGVARGRFRRPGRRRGDPTQGSARGRRVPAAQGPRRTKARRCVPTPPWCSPTTGATARRTRPGTASSTRCCPTWCCPIRNRAVLRMQATIAMIDWLTTQLRTQNIPPTTKILGCPRQAAGQHFRQTRPGDPDSRPW